MKWFLKTVIKQLTSYNLFSYDIPNYKVDFPTADQLRKMGARIRVQGNEAVICGVKTLHGAAVQAQELRGGASLILAALGAKGVTVLEGYSFVQRGYEHICQDLNALGAAVKRIQE